MPHLPQPVRARAFATHRVVRRPSKNLQALAAAQQGELERAEIRRKAAEQAVETPEA